jgi:hypothetical protein
MQLQPGEPVYFGQQQSVPLLAENRDAVEVGIWIFQIPSAGGQEQEGGPHFFPCFAPLPFYVQDSNVVLQEKKPCLHLQPPVFTLLLDTEGAEVDFS